jgi:hypothetical protein
LCLCACGYKGIAMIYSEAQLLVCMSNVAMPDQRVMLQMAGIMTKAETQFLYVWVSWF